MKLSLYRPTSKHLAPVPVFELNQKYFYTPVGKIARPAVVPYQEALAESTRCTVCNELTYDCFGNTWQLCGQCAANDTIHALTGVIVS